MADLTTSQPQLSPSQSVGAANDIVKQAPVTRQAADNSFSTRLIQGVGYGLGGLVSGASTVTSAMFGANNPTAGGLGQLGGVANSMQNAGQVQQTAFRGPTTMSGGTSMLANNALGSGLGGGLASTGSAMTMGGGGTMGVPGVTNVGFGGGMTSGLGMAGSSATGAAAFGAGAMTLPGSGGGGLSTVSSGMGSATTGASSTPGSGGSTQDLMNATQQMQETQMSFNLQYLQLQETMQQDNQQYSCMSNILKTKHDTVKNTISNLR